MRLRAERANGGSGRHYTITITCTDSIGQTASQNVTVKVNDPPVLSYASPQTVVAGQASGINPSSGPSDPNGSVASIAVQSVTPSLVGALTVNNTTGVVSVSSAAPLGSYAVTIRATDNDGATTDAGFTLNVVCPAISLNPNSPLLPGQIGMSYAQQLTATPAGTYSFALSAGNLPSGLTLNAATGVISGLPTAMGTYNFTVKAQAANGCSGTQTYALVINCPTLTLNPPSLPGGTSGTSYNASLSATPAAGNYSFAVTNGVLPTGLSLNPASGAISGTPTANGSYTFTITATGFGSCTGTRVYTVLIGGGGCPAITLPSSLPNGKIGQNYSQTVAAAPAGLYNYVVKTGSLPPGLTLYANAGLLFGYPTTAGTFNFSIEARNTNNCTGSQAYSMTIGATAALAKSGDFDGDGKADAAVFRANLANWLLVLSSNNASQTHTWGAPGDQQAAGDYDGDGKLDLAVFATKGHWRIKRSSDGAVLEKLWGLPSDVPVPGDYDGDKQTDIAVWRGVSGHWYITNSATGQIRIEQWGLAAEPYNDVPVPADYDGDSKTDLAVFRRLDGAWYIRRSADGTIVTRQWGLATDVPVPGDYDGDGQADIAVWRGQAGAWFIIRSSTGALQTATWGSSSAPYHDVPVPGDYDGDGKTDIAVWRPATGMWYSLNSRDGATRVQQHGQAGDLPVTAKPY